MTLPRRPYFARQFDQSTPGLVLFLVDQSESMSRHVGSVAKSEVAAEAINQTLEALVERCRRGPTIINKVHVGVIGYGEATRYELVGSVEALATSYKRVALRDHLIAGPGATTSAVPVEHKIWIEPRAANSTPMAAALRLASQKLSQWTAQYPDGPPPVVLNVTDGAPDDLTPQADAPATRAAAERLRTLDGGTDKVLLFCVHVGSGSVPTLFPASRELLAGPYQKLLFDISSVLPEELLATARQKGLPVAPGCRLLAINATPGDLLRILDFGSSTSVAR